MAGPSGTSRRRVLLVDDLQDHSEPSRAVLVGRAVGLGEAFDVSLLGSLGGARDPRLERVFARRHRVDFDAPGGLVLRRVHRVLDQETPDLVLVTRCRSVPVLEALLGRSAPVVHAGVGHEAVCMREDRSLLGSLRPCSRKAGPCCILPCFAFLQRDHERGALALRFRSYLNQMVLVRIHRRLHHVCVASEFMRASLLRQDFDPGRVSVLPPPLLGATESAAAHPGEGDLVLCPVSPQRGSGIERLLAAVHRIERPLRVMILGEGHERNAVRREVGRLGLGDRVQFCAGSSADERRDAFRNAALAVIPILRPDPLVPEGIEALGHGLPVVGFETGGSSEWLRHEETGLVVSWGDEVGLARSIERILDDRGLARRLAAHGRDHVQRHFGAGAVAGLREQLARTLGIPTEEPRALSGAASS